MSNKLYEENDIQNIANAIRNKNGTEDTYKVSQMSTAINSIEIIEQATAEGESLSLANTKAMPYSDYVVKGKSEQDGEPSPSNPSEIHSVADDVNLFDKDTGIVNGLTYTSNGGTTSLASAFIQETYINVNPNTSYTLSTTNDYSTQDPGEYRLVICEYNASKTFIQRNLGSADVHNKYSIQTTSNTYYVRICASKVTINELKLQKGTVATPYSPYNQGTVTIKQRGTTENNDYTIQTEPLRSLPNGVKDTIEADGIHRRIRVLNLPIADMNNTEDYPGWNNLPEFVAQFPNQNELLKNVTNFMCNIVQNNNPSIGINTKGMGTLWLPKGIFGLTQSQWKEQYPNLAVEIQYQLNEEVIEPLTQNQATTMLDIIKTGSYEDTTNIYTDEDVKPTMKVDYYKKK